MSRQSAIILIIVFALTAVTTARPAKADPLTIIAIVGVATVLSASSVDVIARSDDDNKDMRAQQAEAPPMLAKAEALSRPSDPLATNVTKP